MIYVMSSMLESCMIGLILVMINLVRNLNLQLSIFPTIFSLGLELPMDKCNLEGIEKEGISIKKPKCRLGR